MLQKLVSDKETAATLGEAFSSTLGYPAEALVGLITEERDSTSKELQKLACRYQQEPGGVPLGLDLKGAS